MVTLDNMLQGGYSGMDLYNVIISFFVHKE